MMRLTLVAIVLVAIGAGVAYVMHLQANAARLAADNAQLNQGIETAAAANQSYIDAINHMADEKRALNNLITQRDTAQRSIQRRLNETERKLQHASRAPEITVIERECLHSDIPAVIADVLREAPTGKSGDDDATGGADLPACCTLRPGAGANIQWLDLVRPGSLRQGFASAYTIAQRRPRAGAEFL